MSSQTTKRCHWVPQAYLRAFAANLEQRRKIWRFSKEGGDPELKRIEKVAVRFHLYAPKDASGRRDDSFEKKLASLEQWFVDPVWRTLQTDMLDLSWEPLRKLVGLSAAVMFLRNPLNLERTKTIHDQLASLVASGPELPDALEINGKSYRFDQSSWPSFRDATEDDIKRSWIDEMSNAAHYAKLMMQMRWSVIFSDSPVFITSDNPITFVHPSMRFRGVTNPDTTIFFPLSPTRLLAMDNRHSEPCNQYYPLRGTAASFNALIWKNAIEYMFSSRNPDLVCKELVADERMYSRTHSQTGFV